MVIGAGREGLQRIRREQQPRADAQRLRTGEVWPHSRRAARHQSTWRLPCIATLVAHPRLEQDGPDRLVRGEAGARNRIGLQTADVRVATTWNIGSKNRAWPCTVWRCWGYRLMDNGCMVGRHLSMD